MGPLLPSLVYAPANIGMRRPTPPQGHIGAAGFDSRKTYSNESSPPKSAPCRSSRTMEYPYGAKSSSRIPPGGIGNGGPSLLLPLPGSTVTSRICPPGRSSESITAT